MRKTIEQVSARLMILAPVLLIAALMLANGRKAEAAVHIPVPVQAPAVVHITEVDEPVNGAAYHKGDYVYSELVPMPLEYQKVMQDACKENNVPYALALGITECESSFDPWADSGVAYGYMQIAYINFDWLRGEGIIAGTRKGNIDAGCRIIGELLERYDTHRALMAYNCGEYGASLLWDEGYESSAYSRKVVGAAERWAEIVGG